MSAAATAIPGKASERISFLDSNVGKKVVMAATGVVLFGFVIVHMLGNLQIYLGAEKLDAYGRLLKSSPLVLWGARAFLGLSVILHVITAIQLAGLKAKARPVGYAKTTSVGSNYASRTMLWSGPILFAFIVYHLLHFTVGSAHPKFVDGEVYRNVVLGFQQVPVSTIYIVAMVLLCMHLYHGAWSMFQSIGISHPRYTPMLKTFAATMAVVVAVGNISIPVAVLAGLIK